MVSAILALGAVLALFKFKFGVLPLLAASGMIGLIATLAIPGLR